MKREKKKKKEKERKNEEETIKCRKNKKSKKENTNDGRKNRSQRIVANAPSNGEKSSDAVILLQRNGGFFVAIITRILFLHCFEPPLLKIRVNVPNCTRTIEKLAAGQ